MKTTTSKGQVGEKDMVVYFVNAAGDLMMAPDTRMKAFDGWRRVECRTVSEIEAFSRRFAQQEFDKMRGLKVQDHLRYKAKRDQIRANATLRLAKGCISEADEAANRLILRRLDNADERLYKLLANEPDLSRASLQIERHDSETIKANSNGKRRGLADSEIDIVNALVQGVR